MIPYLYAALGGLFLRGILRAYAQTRQLALVHHQRPRPRSLAFITDAQWRQAQRYAEANVSIELKHEAIMLAIAAVVWTQAWVPWVWTGAGTAAAAIGYPPEQGDGLVASILFLSAFQTAYLLIQMPFDAFQTFFIERPFGFSHATPKTYALRIVRMLVLRSVLAIPVASLAWYVIHWAGRDQFHVYLWTALLAYQLVFLGLVYPIQTHFCFRKKPVEGALRDKLARVATHLHFDLRRGGIFTDAGHAASSHSNAYIMSVCGKNRIVVERTLLQQVSDEEAVAAVAHEIGHWAYTHWLYGMVWGQVCNFIVIGCVGWLINDADLYTSFGHDGAQPLALGLILSMVVATPVSWVTKLLTHALTRRRERQADEFAASHGYGAALTQCLIKLQIQNRDEFESDWVYSLMNDSHPTLLQRIADIERVSRHPTAVGVQTRSQSRKRRLA